MEIVNTGSVLSEIRFTANPWFAFTDIDTDDEVGFIEIHVYNPIRRVLDIGPLLHDEEA